jgi:hypothetical protein
METIEHFHELTHAPGFLDFDYVAGPWIVRLFIKLRENRRIGPLATGKTVHDGQQRVLSQRTQLLQKVSGGTVKGHIDDRLVLKL